jgi:hypothetical protein
MDMINCKVLQTINVHGFNSKHNLEKIKEKIKMITSQTTHVLGENI